MTAETNIQHVEGEQMASVVNEKKMEEKSQLLTGVLLEDKIANTWPEYPCLYDVRSRFERKGLSRNCTLRYSLQY